MTPAGIRAEIAKAGLKNVSDIPTCSVANQHITNGDQARASPATCASTPWSRPAG